MCCPEWENVKKISVKCQVPRVRCAEYNRPHVQKQKSCHPVLHPRRGHAGVRHDHPHPSVPGRKIRRRRHGDGHAHGCVLTDAIYLLAALGQSLRPLWAQTITLVGHGRQRLDDDRLCLIHKFDDALSLPRVGRDPFLCNIADRHGVHR